MVFAWRWARSRLLAGFQGCSRGARDHGGPSIGQARSYGPRIHCSRSAFAAPLAHGESLSARNKDAPRMEDPPMTTDAVPAAVVPPHPAWRSLLWTIPFTVL